MAQLYESFNDQFTLLPVKIYRHRLSGHYIYSPLHWHRSTELTVTLTGSIRFNVGSNDFDFAESDMILINSAEFHSCRYINPEDYFTGISILFSQKFLEKWLGENMIPALPEDPSTIQSIRHIAEEIYLLDDQQPSYNLALMSKVFQLLELLTMSAHTDTDTHTVGERKRIETVTKLTDYIEDHYNENLSLEKISQEFNYSPSYFSRMFKDAVGVNFHPYLNFVRVSHAAEQMSHGQVNLAQCGFENGFPNTKSFITHFKRLYGCTPSAFASSVQ